MPVAEYQSKLLPHPPTVHPSIFGVSLVFNLLLQELLDYVLQSDNSHLLKDGIRHPLRVFDDLCHDGHLELPTLEKLEDRLQFGLVVYGDHLSHENAGELLQGRQVVIYVGKDEVSGHQNANDVLRGVLIDGYPRVSLLVDCALECLIEGLIDVQHKYLRDGCHDLSDNLSLKFESCREHFSLTGLEHLVLFVLLEKFLHL